MNWQTLKLVLNTVLVNVVVVIFLSGCLVTGSRPQGTTVGNPMVDVELGGTKDSETSLGFCISSLSIYGAKENGHGSKAYHFKLENTIVELSPTGNFIQKIELPPGRYNRITMKLRNFCKGGAGNTHIVNSHGSFHGNGAIKLTWEGDVDVSEVDSVITLQVEDLLEAASLVGSDGEIKDSLESTSNELDIAVMDTETEEIKLEVILSADINKGESVPEIKGCISGIVLGSGDEEYEIFFPVGEKKLSDGKDRGIGKLYVPAGTYDHGAILLDPCSKLKDASITLKIDGKALDKGEQKVDVALFDPTEIRFEGEIVVNKKVKKLTFLLKSLLERAKTVRTDGDLEDLLEGSTGLWSVNKK